MLLDGKTVMVALSGRNVNLGLAARALGEPESGHRRS
jgi:hypothetical protein